jgi:hypothetical protein
MKIDFKADEKETNFGIQNHKTKNKDQTPLKD